MTLCFVYSTQRFILVAGTATNVIAIGRAAPKPRRNENVTVSWPNMLELDNKSIHNFVIKAIYFVSRTYKSRKELIINLFKTWL